MERQAYEDLINDAKWRIGSFVSSGGSSEDEYVKEQIHKIQNWQSKLSTLEREEGKGCR